MPSHGTDWDTLDTQDMVDILMLPLILQHMLIHMPHTPDLATDITWARDLLTPKLNLMHTMPLTCLMVMDTHLVMPTAVTVTGMVSMVMLVTMGLVMLMESRVVTF